MSIIVLIGRILFFVLFAMSAVGHLSQTKAMAGYATSRGVPGGVATPAVLITGLMLAAGSLMVLLGVWADVGALLLAVFLIPTAFVMHAFWRESDAGAKQIEQIQFNKDLALGGAALMLFAFFAYVGSDLVLTLTGPLFNFS